MNGQELPANLAAEKAVLGIGISNPAMLASIFAEVGPDDFYRTAHRGIFSAMRALFDRGVPVDLVTLTAELRREASLEAVGGVTFVAALVDGVPRVQGVSHWCRLIEDAARRRELIAAAEELRHGALDGGAGIAELVDRVRTRVDRLSNRCGLLSMAAVVDAALEELKKGPAACVEFGLRDLDRVTGGLHRGELVTAGSRTSIGKSSIVAQVAQEVATAGHRVVAFTLEMPPKTVAMRLLLQKAKTSRWHLGAGGDVGREAWQSIDAAAEFLRTLKIEWDSSSSPTFAQINAKAKQAAAKGDLGLVMVDYFQRIAVPAKPERWAALGQVARGLKSLALDLDVPVLLAAQLNRDAEGRRPSLADLRECGDLEQESDVVLLLHRDRDTEDVVVPTEVNVAKNRNGPSERVTVGFHRKHFQFVNMAGGDDE